MSMVAAATRAFETAPLPDAVSRLAIRALVAKGARTFSGSREDATAAFAEAMKIAPIARDTAAANRQHYEVPAAFFDIVLGAQRKYSCCYYESAAATLADAEEAALAATAERARLADGQAILELGCGWGSLSFWMARAYPNARIHAVSNSASQGAFILREAERLGCAANLRVETADMNAFDTAERYDRIVSVEMFEHMANWRALLERSRQWIADDGRMFVHVFSHITTPYAFDVEDEADWIGQHFFTGGIMPSHRLMHQFSDLFTVEADWRWSGHHYQRTANDWLANFDANRSLVHSVLEPVYGRDTDLWLRRWRLFFLATAGLFGHRGGSVWGVSHYRLAPARAP